jgi:integrase
MEKRGRGRPPGTTKGGQTRYLTESELQAFFKIANRSKRDSLLFNLILFFGLRSKEAAELQLENFDLRDLKVEIKAAKGGLKRDYVEVPDEIWRKLRDYLKVRKAHPMNPHLFPSRSDVWGHMTCIGIQMLFKRICRKAGLVAHSVHDLRHTKGRELALMNFGAYRIARYLRQRSPASADRYVDLKDDRTADMEVFNKAKVY